ncbi:hypothetical protein B484DRAFT_467030 [Ochromonadaceae sp. CCMP2298]|nr:hypothetical protein B484DRAFT_467030 [Ochromonadaceae sp. CCMP2298]
MVRIHNWETGTTVIRFVSGYPEGLFVDSRPPDMFQCSICIDTVNDPVMCGNQHTFCRECISEWLRAHQSCPACKVRVTASSLVRNRTAAEFIGQCKVRCLTAIPEVSAPPAKKERKADTCEWVGTTDTLDRHMQECGYIQVPCESGTLPIPCPWKGRRRALAEHTAVCEYRKVACIFCGTDVQVFARALHQAGCKWRPALCSNIGCNILNAHENILRRCAWKGLRSGLKEHAAVCEYRKEACSYCGTDVEMWRMDLHRTSCDRRPVICHNAGCEVLCAYAGTADHRAVCPREEIGCPYGCPFRCARNNMPAHAGDASAHFAGLMTSQASAASQGSRGEPIKALKREDTHRTEGSFQLSPTNNTFASYDSSRDQLTAGGFRWGLEVVECEGLVWACLTLLEGVTCPFTIDYHLYSIGEGGFDIFKLDISKSLSGTMGECAAGARVKGVILTSRKELDQWHTARHTLHLHTTFIFKVT